MKTKLLTLSLLSVASLNANAAFVAFIKPDSQSEFTIQKQAKPQPPKPQACITRDDLMKKIRVNEDVSNANTSCITNFSAMFMMNKTFNQDI
ncbi:hypothetical protein AB4264_25550, partial [Vibrio sp. 10N.261.55.B8]